MTEPDTPAPLPPEPPPTRSGIAQMIRDGLALDRRAVAILVTVPVVLTLLEYYGLPWHYTRYVERRARITTHQDPPFVDLLGGLQLPGPIELQRYLWWGIACLVLLVAIPTIAGALARMTPRDFGVRLKGTGRDAWVYLTLYAIFLPVIWLVSGTDDFQRTYPFFKPEGHPLKYFIIFEVIYCSQFFAIEYFFRGFIVLDNLDCR